MNRQPNFFEALVPFHSTQESFDAKFYAPAPDDWLLAVTDVVSSTHAVESGRYQLVNLAGAAGIAAVRNVCGGESIPFLFCGDGAVLLIQPAHEQAARTALAQTIAFVHATYDLTLRAGGVRVDEIRRCGHEVLVARYEPTPGNSFAHFLGGGVQFVEAVLKGRDASMPASAIAITASVAESPPDLSGLSCRWAPLKSERGRMVALILSGAADLREAHNRVLAIADPDARGVKPMRLDNLKPKWALRAVLLEAHARGGRLPFALRVLMVAGHTLVAWLIFRSGARIFGFDPKRYVEEMARNNDFSKYDDMLSMVLDCTQDRIEAIRAHLDERMRCGELDYGIHVSDTALMTCLVESATGARHVHFIDGSDGGYTMAAREMKSRIAARAGASGGA